jgi:hypothetical protein
MTAREMIAVLRRRWYVLAAAGLCTIVGAAAVHKRPIMFQACNALFVTAPSTHANPNAYTNENTSLVATAGVATRAVMSSQVQQAIRSRGLTGSYDAEMTNTGSNENPAFGEPTLQICSTSPDPAMAISTTNGATKQFQQILFQRQAAQHVAPESMITVALVAEPAALPILGHPSQAYLGVGLLGLVGGVALTLWSDPFLSRRQRGKAGQSRARPAAGPGRRHMPALGRQPRTPGPVG